MRRHLEGYVSIGVMYSKLGVVYHAYGERCARVEQKKTLLSEAHAGFLGLEA